MTNFNRMTIRSVGDKFQVFKLKAHHTGTPTDMAARKVKWFVSPVASAKFTGSYDECAKFIESQSAEFMSEHGMAV